MLNFHQLTRTSLPGFLYLSFDNITWITLIFSRIKNVILMSRVQLTTVFGTTSNEVFLTHKKNQVLDVLA